MRISKYKQSIIELLRKTHLASIADIHAAIPDADYSTIFRNVEQLQAVGDIKQVVLANKVVAYELTEDNHDHFICTDCGSIEILQMPIRSMLPHTTISDVTVRGVCTDCIIPHT